MPDSIIISPSLSTSRVLMTASERGRQRRAPRSVDAGSMALSAGTRLGPYEILSPLGAGGMGEVYRARDMKLGRDVALKILPPAFAADADRLARFEREARVLASLNHPHIAAIHGFETLAGRRPWCWSWSRARRWTTRAPGTAAHGRGDGDRAADRRRARGRAREGDRPSRSQAGQRQDHARRRPSRCSTSVSQRHSRRGLRPDCRVADDHGDGTSAGIILGTVAYMSPEQARGQAVDKRTDIWAFGCVLYEMLTGPPAFGRQTVRTSSPRSSAPDRIGVAAGRHASPHPAPAAALSREGTPAAAARHRRRADRARRGAGGACRCAARPAPRRRSVRSSWRCRSDRGGLVAPLVAARQIRGP